MSDTGSFGRIVAVPLQRVGGSMRASCRRPHVRQLRHHFVAKTARSFFDVARFATYIHGDRLYIVLPEKLVAERGVTRKGEGRAAGARPLPRRNAAMFTRVSRFLWTVSLTIGSLLVDLASL